MNGVDPIVRHMLLCDDVRRDAENPRKVNVFGLVSTIRSTSDPPFPVTHPELCVYLLLTEGRGSGEAAIAAVHADAGRLVFTSPTHTLSFGSDPLAVRGLVFRIRDAVFPEAGLYWIEFRYNGKTVARQPLLVR